MSKLFSEYQIRGVTFKNRVWVSPLSQYSCEENGVATNWHMVHLGSRAVGGAGLVMTEATAIQADGRITIGDLGIWNGTQVDGLKPVTEFISSQGSVPTIQLAHAWRKSGQQISWIGEKRPLTIDDGQWPVVGPSPIPYNELSPSPRQLDAKEIGEIVRSFGRSAELAVDAGFKVIELHFAHGFLGCQFLSPLSNRRDDCYGGTLESRARFPLEIVKEVRKAIPDSMPLFARISASEYVQGGIDIEQSIEFSKMLQNHGVDLVDCSSGGNSPNQQIETGPGYQVPFSSKIKTSADVATAAVGMIWDPEQAENVLERNDADAIFLGREIMRNPYWPLQAQAQLDGLAKWPKQYVRSVENAAPIRSS